jgi:peptidyl-prolyl cis-trans isomerase B (cyclophilin B)
MRRVSLLAAALATAGAAAACGGGSRGGQTVTPATAPLATTTTAAAAGPVHCASVPTPHRSPEQFAHEPKLTIARTAYTATIVTNCGTVVVALDGKRAPHTVNSFAFLAAHHYFDNTPCHRLTTAGIFVLQCGDPSGTGTGGPGYTIPDENLAGATYPAGTVAMANTGQPHTGGSQFFFVYANTPLPPKYTPFGRVVQGLDILRAIAAKGTNNSNGAGDGAPLQPVVIESFRVAKG